MNKNKRIQLILIFALIFGCYKSVYADITINMDKIKMIESSGKPWKHNKKSGARGLYQITPIVLKEYNQFHKSKYTLQDLFNAEINYKVAIWYMNVRIPQLLRHFKKSDTVENRLIAYNAGIQRVIDRKLKQETLDYIKKYKKESICL